ncbi:uncharacterized protein LOC107466502 [Arachis duranensis]|uniref:Uncharacterized protein LOC107466502 n=1 Tax=Arachis duranensis TaxID=130453 RepID=A0A9C6WLI3_ARADU|nr:uncharacterized protein LOC107466502 [Arachis duranensis]
MKTADCFRTRPYRLIVVKVLIEIVKLMKIGTLLELLIILEHKHPHPPKKSFGNSTPNQNPSPTFLAAAVPRFSAPPLLPLPLFGTQVARHVAPSSLVSLFVAWTSSPSSRRLPSVSPWKLNPLYAKVFLPDDMFQQLFSKRISSKELSDVPNDPSTTSVAPNNKLLEEEVMNKLEDIKLA